MKILQLCHKMPYPVQDGGAYSLLSTALGLSSHGMEVHVLAVNTPKNWVNPNTIPKEIQDTIHLLPVQVDTRTKPIDAARYLFTSNSYFAARFNSELFRTELINLLKKERFQIVQLEHLYLTDYIKTIRKYSDAQIVLRPQNVEFQVWEQVLKEQISPLLKQYLKQELPKLKKMEINASNKVDGILAIAPHDQDLFSTFNPSIPTRFVPIGFDFEKTDPIDREKQYQYFPVFYHLGSMDWTPNIQGMKWFIQKVIPKIRKVYPEFVLRIAGKKMPSWFREHGGPNVVNDGLVKDAYAYQEDKAILIVPLNSGGGLRAKIIEAMALGKTVISTTLGAEGIPYTHGQNILIADTPDDFVRQVLACKNSMEYCREIGNNAYQLAREHYKLKITTHQMIQFYKEL